jgi:anti-sigma B factor antagonist
MALKFITVVANDITVLRLDGRLVLGEEEHSLRDVIKRLIADKRRKIILNLADVTFLDSAGNGALVSAHHSLRSQGAVLKLCHLTSKFQEVLQIQKLLTVYDIYNTEADALESFNSPSWNCLCPACGERCGPSLIPGGHWVEQTCNNPSCGAQFSIGHSQSSKDMISTTQLTFQTYQKEYFKIQSGPPFKCQILGRLDLFSSPALQKCWRALPPPRRVVFDLQHATEISDAGRTALVILLAGKDDASRATVSLEGLTPEQIAGFPVGAPFYRHMADALTALADISDTPRWRLESVKNRV